MAGSRRERIERTSRSQGLDSDIDMQDEDRQVEASKVHTTKKKARKTGKKVKHEAEQDEESDTLSLEVFLNVPFDILAEICSHLDPRDLLKLCCTSGLFRSLLLSRSGRSIWLAARRGANLPELKGLNEINYALLLHGTTCMTCGREAKTVAPDFILRTRLCASCKLSTLTTRTQLRTLDGLHAQAIACTPGTHLRPCDFGQDAPQYYPSAQLLEVSDTLNELQDKDDLAQDEWESLVSTEPPRSAVQAFVDKQAALVRERTNEAKLIAETLKRNTDEESERLRTGKVSEWENRKRELKVAEWLDEEVEWYLNNVFKCVTSGTGFLSTSDRRAFFRPSWSRPSNDPEDWETIRKQVKDRIGDEARRRAEGDARTARYQRQRTRFQGLRTYYDELLSQQNGEYDKLTFPRFHPFRRLASIKPFWEPEEAAALNDEAWEESLEAINRDVMEYRSSLRIEAIGAILAANRGVAASSFSTNPANYPEDEFDDTFFHRITSLFFSQEAGEGLAPFPACLNFTPRSEYEPCLRIYLKPLHIKILRALLQAAQLDEETATLKDFDELGAAFLWPAHPRKKCRKSRYSATELMEFIYGRHRSSPQDCPELKFKVVGSTVEDEEGRSMIDEQASDDGDEDEERGDEEEEEDD
ncbi:hypothetical protein BCR35DRAFT_311367 [Leucosporidium creatinivorum]|uniref:F-box domain-containing protein n=1 Tax=Leucosporidium creatinivorum TaxID=106004 RepID=A0A1Y2C2K1_9BASI|nr:hypothetical protein BCR35DRAFT_311367 [Leucosporidium creatinivorum]